MRNEYDKINGHQVDMMRIFTEKYNVLFNQAIYSEKPSTDFGVPEVVDKQKELTESIFPTILGFYKKYTTEIETVRVMKMNSDNLQEEIGKVMTKASEERGEILRRIQEL